MHYKTVERGPKRRDSLHAQGADARVLLSSSAFCGGIADGGAGDDDAAEGDTDVAVGADWAVGNAAGGDGGGEGTVGPEHGRVARDGVGWLCRGQGQGGAQRQRREWPQQR